MQWIFCNVLNIVPLNKQQMTTLSFPKITALGMLAKAQDGNQLLNILDAVVDTNVDQVPVPSDAYVMENDYDDSMDV